MLPDQKVYLSDKPGDPDRRKPYRRHRNRHDDGNRNNKHDPKLFLDP